MRTWTRTFTKLYLHDAHLVERVKENEEEERKRNLGQFWVFKWSDSGVGLTLDSRPMCKGC